MSRRPPPPGAPRWGVAVIVAGAGAFAVLLPIAVTRSVPGGNTQPVISDAQAAGPSTTAPAPSPAPSPAPAPMTQVPLTATTSVPAPQTSALSSVVLAGTRSAYVPPSTTTKRQSPSAGRVNAAPAPSPEPWSPPSAPLVLPPIVGLPTPTVEV